MFSYKFLSIVLALTLPVLINCDESTCDIQLLRESCITSGQNCEFIVNSEENCDVKCECTSEFCDVQKLKNDCINDETQSCSFLLYNTQQCLTTCDCGPKTDEPHMNFCDVEGIERDCKLSHPNAVCEFEVIDPRHCLTACDCRDETFVDPPAYSCLEDFWVLADKTACEAQSDADRQCEYTITNEEYCLGECSC